MTESIDRRRALGLLALLAAGCADPFSPRGSRVARVSSSLSSLESVTLIATGDIHAKLNNRAKATGALMRRLLNEDPAAVGILLGDNAGVDGYDWEVAHLDLHYGDMLDRLYAILGNHDYRGGHGAIPSYDYFGDRVGPRGKGYIARTFGAWRVYFMNDNGSALRSEQLPWLKADLEAHPDLQKMAFWHKPMFTSRCTHDTNRDGVSDWMGVPSQNGPWFDALVAAGAELVVQGHVHRYERFPRMTYNGKRDGVASSSGMRSFIVGNGGGNNMLPATQHSLCEKQHVGVGVFAITLRPDRYEWKLIGTDNVVKDSGVEMCRRAL